MPLNPHFRENLERHLDHAAKTGTKREAIAGRIGVSRTALYLWAAGQTEPTEENATQLARALTVPRTEFWLPDEDVGPSEQERLAQLESFARRFRDLAHEMERTVLRDDLAPPAPMREARTEAPAERVTRRRSKG